MRSSKKVGKTKKLRGEKAIFGKWPTLTSAIRSHFAIPLFLYNHDRKTAVLIAPYRSKFQQKAGGRKNQIESRDLWRLLHHPKELSQKNKAHWSKVNAIVGQALDTVDYVHRANKDVYEREDIKYSSDYEWYLRNTYSVGSKKANQKSAARKHIPHFVFGSGDKVLAFGKNGKTRGV